jgi:hypothetical protein
LRRRFLPRTNVGIASFGPWIEEYPFQQRWEIAALELPDAAPTSEGAFYCAEIVQTRPRQTGITRQRLLAGGVQRVNA